MSRVTRGRPPAHQVGFLCHFLKGGHILSFQVLRQAEALGAVLRDFPDLRPFVVGIDAAGNERLTPPRVFAPAFAHLVDLCDGQRRDPDERPIRLGRTFHVGEDVWDLATGLRHVDEVRGILLAGRWGRIGHGLVLAEDPERFYSTRRNQVELPLSIHLLDLVWAWGRACDWLEGRQSEWLAGEIRCVLHGRIPPGMHPEVEACWDAMRAELEPGRCEVLEQPRSERELLGLLCQGADTTGLHRVDCESHWLEVMAGLQRSLRCRLATQGVAIEANPTSNLLVWPGCSDYPDLRYDTLIADNLAVSLNTDDPGLFLTTLPDEFDRMYEARATRRDPDVVILRWLEERARDAARTTFLHGGVPAGERALRLVRRKGGSFMTL
ncbi:MAG: hypothetical protein HY814_07960 [Candidatus Riflebacteria bacterium]|nr:hypothetical protein [Candidatus Riflebacteria bacterium]